MLDPALWSTESHRRLSQLLDEPPGVAAFDFDYTLIQGDQGEALMNEIILSGSIRADEEWFWEEGLWPASVRSARSKLRSGFERSRHFQDGLLLNEWMDDLLDAYEAIREQEGTEAAYRWSSICFAGFTEADLAERSRSVFVASTRSVDAPLQLPSGRLLPRSLRVRPAMRALVHALQERGWEVYVVTASPRIPIAVVVDEWKIRPDHVLGMELSPMEDGRMGPAIVEPYPCASGKVAALRKRTDRPLAFAAGDSMMDVPLLEEAGTALVLDRGVLPLRERAKECGWIVEVSPHIA